jgi:hypothetical protein
MSEILDEEDHEKLEVMASGITDPVKIQEQVTDSSLDPTEGNAASDDEQSTKSQEGIHSTCGIDKQLCDLIQEMYEDSGGWVIATALNLSRDTVYYHATGKCIHVVRGSVDVRLCSAMRAAAAEGYNHSEINQMFDRCPSQWAARYHCTGECTCDHNVSAVPAQGRGAWTDTSEEFSPD